MNLLWLQAGSCGGCSMAALDNGAAGWFAELRNARVNLLWHPSASEATGEEVLEIFERIESGAETLDILCVEGLILRGPNGSGKFNRLSGTGRTHARPRDDRSRPWRIIAWRWGPAPPMAGFPPAIPTRPKPAGCIMTARRRAGRWDATILSRKGLPVINVAGCAPHPGWIMETLQALAVGDLARERTRRAGAPEILRRPPGAPRLLAQRISMNSRPAPARCRTGAA